MPELPEVERAARLIREVASGCIIAEVDTAEDNIVYSGVTHEEFARSIVNRTVSGVGRYGKVFYIELDGEGRMPVLHFGMTGMVQVKGQQATYYKRTPRKAATDWPPRFMKFILHLHNPSTGASTELAFLDARRLGRIRLCAAPLSEPPISALGFDPLLSMPALSDFAQRVRARACPIKALLLDQSFSAGVGNWVADEILYHARVHPEERCNALTEAQLAALHWQTAEVCRVAVSVNADDSKFPENWLFKHRWDKGKKTKHTLTLPDGKPATIKWVTVGGRTSAYVAELQHLRATAEPASTPRSTRTRKRKADDQESESDLTPLSESEHETTSGTGRRKTRRSKYFPAAPEMIQTTNVKRARTSLNRATKAGT
ncbi:hypothetical protein WOLCODRAFT_159936 [Wolfiporia cocos MD-104 SS10]|uniref:Formamidopyrimidine-DNA glycosylase catalytic domain-containing protein n=1 Tax=Wolfiporia cocos (strain MD-104) TaxID=742152 RepID=A0A2H3J0D1_WOLCO|nr:hypothetical protein WOLCODRAFT_159936 [Wolfiporia cocos MD-104 SS10]